MASFKKILSAVSAIAMIASTMTATSYAQEEFSENVISYDQGASLLASTASVTIQASGGDLESAYVEWAAVTNATGYNVYADGTQIDSMLIRQYKTAFRADALGLKAGSHTLKVVPVISGKEDTSKAAEAKVTVTAHDRSGYGFVNGSSSGAYNDDGTLKSGATVIYVTEDTKDTVKVTLPNKSGTATELTGIQNIITNLKSNSSCGPVAIRFIGNITDPSVLNKGDLYVDAVTCGLTIEGVGMDATLNGFGLVTKNSSNVEIRNLGFMNCNSSEGDDCGLQQKNDHMWVHNCDFFYGDAGSDADQVKGDGALDTKTSSYITHSYNHFWDNGKCNLQGMKSETTENYITYHHNWYDHSDSRHPRIRTCTVHIYNNYFDGNAKYGVGVTMGASAFVENNYFRNCAKPMLISMQGSDIAEGEGTFSSENGGVIKAYNNHIEGAKAYVTYSENNTEFDAYEVSSRNDTVPSSVTAKQGGTAYTNFDTASGFYSYTPDSPEDAKTKVTTWAGRVQGGDFKWTFNNATDDDSYAVDTALKAALVAYDDSIVAIGSGFTANTDTPTVTTPAVTTVATAAPVTPSTQTTTVSVEQNPDTGSFEVKAGGWNEMLYLDATGITDSDVTAVKYSGPTSGSLTGEDFEYLVRDSSGGVRVDILGLQAGTYSVTLETKKGNVTKSGIAVGAQDRSGFAHFNYTAGVGAYTDAGTLKSNAIVLYVTDANKDTVSVTSKDGTKVTGIGNILNSVGQDTGSGTTSNGGKTNTNQGIIKKLAADGTPLVVRFIGDVKAPTGLTAYDSVDYGGSVGDNGYMARMKSGKDVTLEGVGTDATVDGWGFHFMAESSATNYGKSFEVRNIHFRNVPEDCIGMEGVQDGTTLTAVVERCWIHNCEFYKPTIANPAESDKAGGDGACDFKRGMYFTNSYCYYEGYHKTNLVGSSDSSLQYHLTYHHNYWKSCESRGPLARQADIHMYDNIFEGQTSYCMNPRANAYIFSEYNVFKDSKNPMQIKLGAIKSYMDVFDNCKGDQQGTIVTDKSTKVSSDNKYANFDTDSSLCYIPSNNYKLDTADSSSLYSSLTSIFDDLGGCMDGSSGSSTIVTPGTTAPSNPTNPTTTTTTVKPVTPVAGDYVHDFTANGTESTFYTISGNLSTSKGSVNYGGKTLTQCLKMETATSITFNAPSAGTLTLVFAEAAPTIIIDNVNYTGADQIITADLAAGSHTISKKDTANLFYMVYSLAGDQPQVTTTTTTATPVQPTTTTTIVTDAPPVVTTTTDKPSDVTVTMWGDINMDNEVSVADVIMANKAYIKTAVASEQGLANADLNGNGEFDSMDIVYILELLVNTIKDTELPIRNV